MPRGFTGPREWVYFMPPVLALIIWLVLLLGLLCFDPARERGTSFALWIPLLWMLIVGSRLPSQWFGLQVGSLAQAMAEGNPLDRGIDLALIVISVAILAARFFNWGGFVLRNLALTAFVVFALISIAWSDFPFVAFKRWFRDLGNYLVILVVLSDPRPLEAVRTLLRRFGYFLIPLSVVLIKYFPGMSRQYDPWTGSFADAGVATSKNMLGVVCLVSGIFFVWDTLTRWPDRKERRTKKILIVNLAFLAMTLWVLNLTKSATSEVCLAIGCLVIWIVKTGWGRRHSGFIKVMIPAGFCLYLILAFGLNLNGELAQRLGRDPTLTDRTLIWNTVLSMNTNPLVGTGYESFWLGPRLDRVWEIAGRVNEAHNGYLEMYLNQGLIGISLFAGLLISSYRTICKGLNSSSLAQLNLALWTVALFYNMTEAAFKSHPMWFIFLLGSMAAPSLAENPVRQAFVKEDGTSRVGKLSFETRTQRGTH